MGNFFCVSNIPKTVETQTDEMKDNGPIDNGPIDNGPIDNGPIDNGPIDNGLNESGPNDNGLNESGPIDVRPTDIIMPPLKHVHSTPNDNFSLAPVNDAPVNDAPTVLHNDAPTVLHNDIYKNCTNDNTPYYSYDGLKRAVKILRIVDGDTVDIALYNDETNKIFKHRIRLYGIDTPEKRPSKSNPNRDAEIDAAKRSSKAMTDKLLENDNIVIALFYKPDKYGRLLATLYDKNGENINEWMITSGYAYAYYGKTKKTFDTL
jgi:endonuclease YncB( thermonuclease family)